MIAIKKRLKEIINQLGPRESINPTQACNAIEIYTKKPVIKALEELNHKGLLTKVFGTTYYKNRNPKIKPLGHRGNI